MLTALLVILVFAICFVARELIGIRRQVSSIR